jgi:hypothetical protein
MASDLTHDPQHPRHHHPRSADNIESHGIKFMLIWLDLLFSSQRLPDSLVALTFGCALVYLCINAAVSLSTYPVYGILTWRAAGTATIAIGALVFVVVTFFLASLIAAYRDRLALRIAGSGAKDAALHDLDAWPAQFRDDPSPLPCGCCRSARTAATLSDAPSSPLMA